MRYNTLHAIIAQCVNFPYTELFYYAHAHDIFRSRNYVIHSIMTWPIYWPFALRNNCALANIYGRRARRARATSNYACDNHDIENNDVINYDI